MTGGAGPLAKPCRVSIYGLIPSMETAEQNPALRQEERLKEARRRTYQTRLIFTKTRLAKRGMQLLTFLGIAVPVCTSGVVASFYVGPTHTPPEPLINISGFLGILLALATVWSLIAEWPRRSLINDNVGRDFDALYIELNTIKSDSNGLYDDAVLSDLEMRSWDGVNADRNDGVTRREKDWAWGEALKKYP
jgi:mobilome CxxCx(11)CxxC protein